MNKVDIKWFDKKSIVIVLLILFWPVGLIALFKNQTFKKKTKTILFIVYGIFCLFIVVLLVIPSGKTTDLKNENQTISDNATLDTAVEYTIIEKDDISIKALGAKNLSEYSSDELEKLPLNKRLRCKVIVAPTIKNNQILPTVNKIIKEITTSDNDIDLIAVFLYSDSKIVNGSYDVASAEWAPNGIWDSVTPEIARNNNRNNYKIKLEIKEDLENYLKNRSTSEEKFGLSDKQRRKVFIELYEAETKATSDADSKYPIPVNGNMDDLQTNANYNSERLEMYKKKICEKYGLSSEKISSISVEGIMKNWPTN